MRRIISSIVLAGIAACIISAQDPSFNVDVYKQFLIDNGDISVAELEELYPSGLFKESVTPFAREDVLYLDAIDKVYKLTTDEMALLMKNGFVVSERLSTGSCFEQFLDIYQKDLPVFISTDAMLHVFHISYDEILKDVERQFLIPKLRELLLKCHSHIGDLDDKYERNQDMKPMLKDVDVYFTMPLRLLGYDTKPFYSENSSVISELENLINGEDWSQYPIFSESCNRDIDFSQFKPRGHYDVEEWEGNDLPNYFRAMMWLGRIELYLSHSPSALHYCDEEEMDRTVQRQIIDAALINELFNDEEIKGIYDEIENIVSFFVGDQDNVKLNDLTELFNETGTLDADAFLVSDNIQIFENSLKTKPYSDQKILSQIMFSDCSSPESLVPPSAFMLFGQRFVIDSYVTGQVVYDRIVYQDSNPCRLFPSTLDILFALGNDASTQLLINELKQWDYSDNLAGLRYLIDQYPEEFWESSLYNMWIYTIKSLNPQPQDVNIPEFMQTGAWGMEKMNTQLSSWTELRHDNMLYAKQSYTVGGACIYPEGYVEPVPEFYRRMKRMAEIAIDKFSMMSDVLGNGNAVVDYFETLYEVCDKLESIVQKELENSELSQEQLNFINGLATEFGYCSGMVASGWYFDLHYAGQDPFVEKFLVADYHTTPTDCVGSPVGWVSHAGTGKVDMLISIVNTPDNQLCANVGPVMSYHEYVSTNFLRLTDEEWKQSYLAQSLRPEWVWNYLADANGNDSGSDLKLFSNQEEYYAAFNSYFVISAEDKEGSPKSSISLYPNPVEYSAIISLNVPESARDIHTRMALYDIQGKVIRVFLDETLSPGHYLTRWERTDESGNFAPPGMYILKLDQGTRSSTTRVVVTD